MSAERVAAIDVGTNSVRLLVGEAAPGPDPGAARGSARPRAPAWSRSTDA